MNSRFPVCRMSSLLRKCDLEDVFNAYERGLTYFQTKCEVEAVVREIEVRIESLCLYLYW